MSARRWLAASAIWAAAPVSLWACWWLERLDGRVLLALLAAWAACMVLILISRTSRADQ